MRHWNTLNNKKGGSFAETAGEAIAEAEADHQVEATKSLPPIFEEAEKLRDSCGYRGPWRSTVRDFLIKNGVNGRLILTGDYELSVHRPSNDGATGPLGHLGICIWRIA